MARREKKEDGGSGSPAWLVTFSDLMTLLLTFFVLLLSMSSLNKTVIVEVNSWITPRNFIERQGFGRLPDRVSIFLELIKDPANLVTNMDRIKDQLFPFDTLPEEMNKSTLDENIKVMENPEGLVISLNNQLLFQSGQYTLTASAKKILHSLVEILLNTTMDINISGHTDDMPMQGMSNYELSGLRAQSVLEYFLQNQVRPLRFSISGYGPDRPVADNSLESGRAANRRVEILLKNENWLGGYR